MKRTIKRSIGIISSIVLIPLIIIIGLFFFSTIAIIVLAIIGLFLFLSLLLYLNKRFKYFLMHIKTSGKAYSGEKTTQKITEQKFHKKTREGEEIVIEHLEERIEEKIKRDK